MSYGAEKVVKASEIVPDSEDPICVVIGAIAKGIESVLLFLAILKGICNSPIHINCHKGPFK
jgi:hypothetical protein